MSDHDSKHSKRSKPRTPWLDPTAILTDEEEAALDEIMADIPHSVVEDANQQTATAADTTEPTPIRGMRPTTAADVARLRALAKRGQRAEEAARRLQARDERDENE